MSITHANLLYTNGRLDDVAARLERLDADVLTFSEYTPHHAARLRVGPLGGRYPHRIECPAHGAAGTALWSRLPITPPSVGEPRPSTQHHTVQADVTVPWGTLRVLVAHTQSPIVHHAQWEADLAELAAVRSALPARSAVMTGDFNAARWHPQFRAVLASGWRDAHELLGRALRPSWPIGHPVLRVPFVRIDHALVTGDLVVTDVRDFRVAGSDHRGLVVTIAPSAPAATP